MPKRTKTDPCPKCGSAEHVRRIPYGHPGHDVFSGHEPKWACEACEHTFGRLVTDEDYRIATTIPYLKDES